MQREETSLSLRMFSLRWLNLLFVLAEQLLESGCFPVFLNKTGTPSGLLYACHHSLSSSPIFLYKQATRIAHRFYTSRLHSSCVDVRRLIWTISLRWWTNPRCDDTEEAWRFDARPTWIFWETVLPSIMETGPVERGKIAPPPPLPPRPPRARPRHVL